MAHKRKNFIEDAIELNAKQTPSDKIFSVLGIVTGAVACLLLLACLIAFLSTTSGGEFGAPYASRYYAALIWYLLYYPMLIIVITGLFCSSGQLIRNRYFSTFIALLLNSLAAITILTVSIVQGVVYGQVFAFPFYFFGN